jgi:hypothetical protein
VEATAPLKRKSVATVTIGWEDGVVPESKLRELEIL